MVSDEQLIQDLQAFSDELGETPTAGQMREHGPWSAETYKRHFGSWNDALKAAGLQINQEQNRPDSKEQLVQDLQEFADELGETPLYLQMDEKGPWSAKTYQSHFGTWNDALKAAGLQINEVRDLSDPKERLIQDLQAFADKLGETPTTRQMKDNGPWSAETYKRHFGSWNEALKAAGLDPIREYPVAPAWTDDVDDYYGDSWPEMRERAVQRDDGTCRVCGDDGLVHVHHITPRRYFEDPDDSNTLDNLITLCVSCHGRFENRWTDTTPDEFEAKARELLSVV